MPIKFEKYVAIIHNHLGQVIDNSALVLRKLNILLKCKRDIVLFILHAAHQEI